MIMSEIFFSYPFFHKYSFLKSDKIFFSLTMNYKVSIVKVSSFIDIYYLMSIQKNEVQNILAFLGCNDHEMKTFQALLQFPGGISVVDLAKFSNTTRPTLYDHLDSLINKGLAKKYSQEKSSLYAPQDYKILLELYEAKIKHLDQNKKVLKQLFSQKMPAMHTPRFSVFEGKQSVESVCMDILRSRPKITHWIWPIRTMITMIPPEFFEYFHTERMNRGIHAQVPWSEESQISIDDHPFLLPHEKALREIRILPKEISPTVAYGIYDNKVAVIADDQESFAFIVESPGFAHTLISEFEYLWGKSKGM